MSPDNIKTENGKAKKTDFLVKIKRRAKLLYLRILRLDDPPERIARGAAVGVLMGVLPTFGLGGLLAFAFAFVFKANKAAAVIASAVVNPLTAPFFWTASIVIGSAITGNDSATMLAKFKGEEFLTFAGEASTVYLAGNALISLTCTVGAYFTIKAVINRHRARKAASKRTDA